MSVIVADVFLSPDNIISYVDYISALNGGGNSVSLSSGEDQSNQPLTGSALQDYVNDRVKKNIGFIISEGARIFVFGPSSVAGNWKVSIEGVEEGLALDLVKAAAYCSSDFAFSCSLDELEHRNKIILRMDYGQEEAWVGRDFTKYLPGLYWLTMLPISRIADPSRLEEIVTFYDDMDMTTIGDRIVLRLYKSAREWVDDGKVYQLNRIISGAVFDKSLVQKSLEGVSSFLAVSDGLADWP